MTSAVAIGAGIVAAGAIASSAISSSAASSAASKQEQAAQNATQEQQYQFDTTNTNEAPYRAAGQTALNQLNAGTAPGGQFTQTYNGSDLTSDPGYQFRLQQGLKGVQNSGSAAGMTLSGAQLSALDQYNQGFASNEYQNAYNRYTTAQQNRYNNLYSIAGLGQNATAVTGAIGQQTANNISSNDIGAGNAAAAGTVGSANAVNSGISTLSNYYQQQNALANSQSSYSNPQNLGGSTPTAPAGSNLTYDQWGNITGSAAI